MRFFDFNAGRCKRDERFSHLSGFWTHPYWHSTEVVSRRRPGFGFTTNSICSGLNNDRPLPVNLSMGSLSQKQSGCQNAYSFGFERSNSDICGFDYRKDSKVLASFEEIQVGDGLLPYTEMEPPVVTHIANGPDVNGYIVDSYRGITITSAGEIIYLDKGEKDGLGIGNVFSILSETPVKRPIGTLQIISLQPTTSKAVILKTAQEATIGDMWGKEQGDY